MQSTQTYYVSAIWQGLVGWSSNGTTIPQLADWWKISSDGLTYTFNLRSDLKWSDGQPLTSADVLFSVNQTAIQSSFWAVGIYGPLLVSNSNNPSGEALAPGAVTAPNSTEVIFHLSAANAPFILNAGGWEIIPQHTYANFNWNTGNPDMTKIVGSGAFIPTSFTSGVQLTEAANPNYYLGAPKLSQEIVKFYSDSPSAELAFESGQINVLQDVPPTDSGAISKTPGVSLATQEDQSMVYLIFNMGAKLADNSTNPYLERDGKTRHSYGDRHEHHTQRVAGRRPLSAGEPDRGPEHALPGSEHPEQQHPQPCLCLQPHGSRTLLDKAGYPMTGANRFTINMIYSTNGFGSAGSGASLKILQLFQADLANVGITLNLVPLDPATYNSELFNGQPLVWSISVQTISESPDGDVGPFYIVGGIGGNAGAGGWNAGGYNNTVVNGLLKQEEATTNAAQRVAILRQIDSIAFQDFPVFPLYYNIELVAYDSNYQGFHFGLGDPEYDYWGDLKPSSISQVSIVSSTSTSAATTASTSTGSSSSYTPLGLIGAVAAVAVVSGVLVIGVLKSRRRQAFSHSISGA